MRPQALNLSPWRWIAGVLAGCAASAVCAGASEASGAVAGGRLQALVFGAGLAAPLGLAVGLGAVAGLAALFAADPIGAWRAARRSWRGSPDEAARFACRAAALGLAAVLWMTLAAHAVRVGRQAFHHMGLAALLVSAGLLLAAAALWLLAAAASRVAAVRLARRVSPRLLAALAPLALAVFPACCALLYAAAPLGGTGIFGALGLLKRDEIELAFLWPLVIAAAASIAAFSLITRRAAPAVVAAISLACGASITGTAIAARPDPAEARTLGALDARGGLAAFSLRLLRSASDRDRDGASAQFGGGDCDDADPAISPAAIDKPGNGVDEDCTGADAAKRSAASAPAEPVRSSARPGGLPEDLSLVMLSVDALRWDLGFEGYARPISPRIDALAAQGVVFDKAYALSSFTGRAIGPMMAGRYPSETFCNSDHFSRYGPKNEMLAEVLKTASFATAGVQGHFYFERGGLDQGFDKWVVVEPPGPGDADQRTTSREIADEAIAILGDARFTKGRFFLWAHFMDPHKEYLEHEGFSVYGTKARDRYDGEVAFTDFHLGRVVDAIEKAGLGGRTIIMVTGDHGEAFKEHGALFHGRYLWEEIIRVPWIWVVPGLAPRRVGARVSQVDLVATACDLLGVEPSPQLRGPSLLPYMTGAATADERVFIDQPLGPYMPEAHAVIDGGKKLVHTAIGNRYELYDLDADPGERNDLAPTNPDELGRMKAIYQETRASLEQDADVYRP
jgi:choline-sulfatase